MTEILTLLLVLHLHKIMYFLKMSKTHHKKNFLSPFKNIVKIMSRRPCILRHIRAVPTSTPFAPFRLQTLPLSPFPFHVAKHMVFSTQDGPDPPKVLDKYYFRVGSPSFAFFAGFTSREAFRQPQRLHIANPRRKCMPSTF